MTDFTVRYRDLVRKGFCGEGQRAWFAAQGLDFDDFLKNGIPASVGLATGDGLAQEAFKMLEAERGRIIG